MLEFRAKHVSAARRPQTCSRISRVSESVGSVRRRETPFHEIAVLLWSVAVDDRRAGGVVSLAAGEMRGRSDLSGETSWHAKARPLIGSESTTWSYPRSPESRALSLTDQTSGQ